MELKYVTCSGANETTNIDALFALYDLCPHVEFGIQVSGKKCSENSPRLKWLRSLRQQMLLRNVDLPLALHLNQDWVTGFCEGNIVPELQELLSYANKCGNPMFKRVQLNFKIGREKAPNLLTLEQSILKFPQVRFILSYNSANAILIEDLYRQKKVVFDCLFDESYGEGIVPKQRRAPIFKDMLQGYAGGFSAKNVVKELQKISLVLPKDAQFFIDAEGKLKGEDGNFSFTKAHDFVMKAMLWQEKNV